mgnify:FL=1
MKKILTGLKPTGELTLGNYIGAIKQMKQLQDQYDSYLFVADLHALTIPQNPSDLRRRIRDFLALYIACGIDSNKNLIYLQSENEFIPAISWLLECSTYYGEASRMIQFKEKSKQHSNFSVGLLTYPVLMAADILYADIDLVPVGIDQKQHVELARDIAIRFNKNYGDTFVIPEALISETGTKIKDLKDPTKKMSKSEENPNGVILMLDEEKAIRKKIMGATTDSEMSVHFDEEKKPGISNLMNIYAALKEKTIDEIEAEFQGENYGTFKKKVADAVVETLLLIQERYHELLHSNELDHILDQGIAKSREIAKNKYQDMAKKMGLER